MRPFVNQWHCWVFYKAVGLCPSCQGVTWIFDRSLVLHNLRNKITKIVVWALEQFKNWSEPKYYVRYYIVKIQVHYTANNIEISLNYFIVLCNNIEITNVALRDSTCWGVDAQNRSLHKISHFKIIRTPAIWRPITTCELLSLLIPVTRWFSKLIPFEPRVIHHCFDTC